MATMLLTLELLRQYSNTTRGLVFYEDTDDISNFASFAYNYILTILGLALLALWSFTTYDVFRLEPYFQLSKNQMFSADVLSANYIFGPFVSTPISAARRKHWVVLGVSMVNILLQLLMPAMLSSLLEVDEVSITYRETLRSWPKLVGVSEQAEWISSQRNTSLEVPMMKGSAKTTSRLAELVIPPVELPLDSAFTTASWKLNHSVYWTDLVCSELGMNSPPTVKVTASAVDAPRNHSRLSWELQDLRVASTSDASSNCTLHVNYSGIFDLAASSFQARRWEIDEVPCASHDLYGFLLEVNATELSQLVQPKGNFSVQNPKFVRNLGFFSCDMEFYMATAEVSISLVSKDISGESYVPEGTFAPLKMECRQTVLSANVIWVQMVMDIRALLRHGRHRLQNLSDATSDRISIPLSVVPAIIASMMRALFNSIYLNLGILEPWIHLQKGGADAKSSLLLNLSSQNPITVFWRSIRSRHIVLSLASLCCVINTGLPAVLGALFTQSRNETAWPTHDVTLHYNDSVVLESSVVPTSFQYESIESTLLIGVQSLPWTTPDHSFIPFSVAASQTNHAYEAAALGIGVDLDCQQIFRTQDISKNQHREVHVLAPLQPEGDTDFAKFIVVANGLTHKQNVSSLECRPIVQLQKFSINFNSNGILRYYSPVESAITSGPLMKNMTSNLAKYHHQFVSSLQGTQENATFAGGPRMFLPDWPGSLIKLVYQKLNPELTPINPEAFVDATKAVYQWLFSTYFTSQRDVYLQHLTTPVPVPDAKVMRNTWSIDRSLPSFIVAIVMVSFMTFVLVLVFITRYDQFKGPRIPRSLGSVLVWLADSPILPSFSGTYDWSSADRRDYLVALDRRYVFRMITTSTGEHKWVIEEEPPEKPA
ncbi:hypothetical protein BBP40_001368 [Aspergillus hancockii]|nr:hypothetical protein BBP40_001368 [Aspergillus hancockii]